MYFGVTLLFVLAAMAVLSRSAGCTILRGQLVVNPSHAPTPLDSPLSCWHHRDLCAPVAPEESVVMRSMSRCAVWLALVCGSYSAEAGDWRKPKLSDISGTGLAGQSWAELGTASRALPEFGSVHDPVWGGTAWRANRVEVRFATRNDASGDTLFLGPLCEATVHLLPDDSVWRVDMQPVVKRVGTIKPTDPVAVDANGVWFRTANPEVLVWYRGGELYKYSDRKGQEYQRAVVVSRIFDVDRFYDSEGIWPIGDLHTEISLRSQEGELAKALKLAGWAPDPCDDCSTTPLRKALLAPLNEAVRAERAAVDAAWEAADAPGRLELASRWLIAREAVATPLYDDHIESEAWRISGEPMVRALAADLAERLAEGQQASAYVTQQYAFRVWRKTPGIGVSNPSGEVLWESLWERFAPVPEAYARRPEDVRGDVQLVVDAPISINATASTRSHTRQARVRVLKPEFNNLYATWFGYQGELESRAKLISETCQSTTQTIVLQSASSRTRNEQFTDCNSVGCVTGVRTIRETVPEFSTTVSSLPSGCSSLIGAYSNLSRRWGGSRPPKYVYNWVTETREITGEWQTWTGSARRKARLVAPDITVALDEQIKLPLRPRLRQTGGKVDVDQWVDEAQLTAELKDRFNKNEQTALTELIRRRIAADSEPGTAERAWLDHLFLEGEAPLPMLTDTPEPEIGTEYRIHSYGAASEVDPVGSVALRGKRWLAVTPAGSWAVLGGDRQLGTKFSNASSINVNIVPDVGRLFRASQGDRVVATEDGYPVVYDTAGDPHQWYTAFHHDSQAEIRGVTAGDAVLLQAEDGLRFWDPMRDSLGEPFQTDGPTWSGSEADTVWVKRGTDLWLQNPEGEVIEQPLTPPFAAHWIWAHPNGRFVLVESVGEYRSIVVMERRTGDVAADLTRFDLLGQHPTDGWSDSGVSWTKYHGVHVANVLTGWMEAGLISEMKLEAAVVEE
ncbi:MAG: hypothetical protein ACI8PZ_005243 [Myxococcota bacterium]